MIKQDPITSAAAGSIHDSRLKCPTFVGMHELLCKEFFQLSVFTSQEHLQPFFAALHGRDPARVHCKLNFCNERLVVCSLLTIS